MSNSEYRKKKENPGVVWRGRSPSKCNPQQRPVRCEEHFCEAEHALREQKCFPCAFSARESRRDERKRRFLSIKWRIHLIDEAVQRPPCFLFRPVNGDGQRPVLGISVDADGKIIIVAEAEIQRGIAHRGVHADGQIRRAVVPVGPAL